ncbi:hypothetical protein NDS46_31665 (plasmid) [Paenibacillus thiaminolyticus]|uniref:hypothetical protein n=1 Tax=Paenibacillus thiaminolyticus TaxID=49283 RepID=UPI00232C16E5|nr:hypothetical protein [Paenibacillus thiaminolyticus]WCF11517.1 hypothetical protein NDS46_31665 [Paenibacillus thiaminolyticus]
MINEIILVDGIVYKYINLDVLQERYDNKELKYLGERKVDSKFFCIYIDNFGHRYFHPVMQTHNSSGKVTKSRLFSRL